MPDIRNKALYDEITLANEVIAVVKRILGAVPLNVRGRAELAVDHQGDIERFAEVWAERALYLGLSDDWRANDGGAPVRQLARVTGNQVRVAYDPTAPQHRPKVTMAALADRGVGMCQDYASLTYGLLRALLPPTRSVSYIFEDGITHYYCTVGDFAQRTTGAGPTLIVVDSWYRYADAVLWADSHHSAAGYGGQVLYCKPGKNNTGPRQPTESMGRNLIASARQKYTRRPPTTIEVQTRDAQRLTYRTWMMDQTNFTHMQYGNLYTNAGNNGRVNYDFIPVCMDCPAEKRGPVDNSHKWHECNRCHQYRCGTCGYRLTRSGYFTETRTCTCGGVTRVFN